MWCGLVAPAGLPAPVVVRLHAEVQKALATPELRDCLTGAGGEVLPGPKERLGALLTSEKTRCEKLIRDARIQPTDMRSQRSNSRAKSMRSFFRAEEARITTTSTPSSTP